MSRLRNGNDSTKNEEAGLNEGFFRIEIGAEIPREKQLKFELLRQLPSFFVEIVPIQNRPRSLLASIEGFQWERFPQKMKEESPNAQRNPQKMKEFRTHLAFTGSTPSMVVDFNFSGETRNHSHPQQRDFQIASPL